VEDEEDSRVAAKKARPQSNWLRGRAK